MKKLQINKLAIAIALGLSSIGSNVMAQANNFDEAKQQISNGKRVVEVGFAKFVNPPLKGFATSLPLVEVLKQITPNGWVVKKNDTAESRINVLTPVSWTGGNPWNLTLESVLQQANTNAVIDWNAQEVTLVSLPKSSSKNIVKIEESKNKNTISVFEMEGSGEKTEAVVKGGSSYENSPIKVKEEKIVESKPIEVVSTKNIETVTTVETTTFRENDTLKIEQDLARQEWTLSAEKTLRENVKSWGKQAGYEVEWLGEDYPINKSMILFGQFDGEEGPIRQLSDDYGINSRLQKPLSFILYQNKVLVVEDMKFEQQGFPQFGQ